jgi:AraC-like DNA-binding protein
MHPRTEFGKRSRKIISQWLEKRQAWIEEFDTGFLFHRLFDQIPGVHFFIKDENGHTMFVSQGILERYRMRTDEEMLGLTDYDINPGSMAKSYVEDDRRLLSGETDRVERMELWFDRQGMVDWFVVTKLPLVNRRGKVRGVVGVLRRPAQAERQLPLFETVAAAVEHIRREYRSPLLISDVATKFGLSLRQLQRRFNDAFGISPQEFLLKTRVTAAARLLEESSMRAGEIAASCGFVDQSAFAAHFKKWTGMTPSDYREAKRRN